MNGVTIIASALSLLFVAFCLFNRHPNGLLLSVDNIVILSVSFMWGLFFPITYFYSLEHPNNEYLEIISGYQVLDVILYYICIALFLFVFVQIFRLTASKQHLNPFYIEEDIIDDESNQLYVVSIIVLFIGVVSDLLYCKAYGGYFGYLEYSAYIRSGLTTIVNNPWSFLIAFRDCVILSSYFLLAKMKTNGKFPFVRVLLFGISFVYSLMILYANKGRLSLVVYILIIFSTHLIRKHNIEFLRIKHMFSILFLFVAGVVGIGWISIILNRSNDLAIDSLFVNEIAFVFANFKVLIDQIEFVDMRFFIDIISYPLFLLPSSLWTKIIPNTASDIMTIIIFGNKKGHGEVYGEAPIDAISIGYLQCGIIGVCVFAIFFGIVSAKVYNRICNFQNLDVRRTLCVYIIIDIFVRSLFYADSYNIVQRSFSLVVFLLIYWGCGLLCKERIYLK